MAHFQYSVFLVREEWAAKILRKEQEVLCNGLVGLWQREDKRHTSSIEAESP